MKKNISGGARQAIAIPGQRCFELHVRLLLDNTGYPGATGYKQSMYISCTPITQTHTGYPGCRLQALYVYFMYAYYSESYK